MYSTNCTGHLLPHQTCGIWTKILYSWGFPCICQVGNNQIKCKSEELLVDQALSVVTSLTCKWDAISVCFLLTLFLATGVSQCWNRSLLDELIFVCASWCIIALFQWRTGSTHEHKLFCCLTKHIYKLEHQPFTNRNLIKVYFSFRLKTCSFGRFYEMKCFAWASKH